MTTTLQDIVKEITPMKDSQVKGNSKSWFDSSIMEAIRVTGKLKETFLRAKLHVDHDKAYSIVEIPGRFLKDGAELLTEPLCKIINLPLSSKFPLMCKTAKVKSLYKKRKNTNPENYRPVLLLPILSKIIEVVVHN